MKEVAVINMINADYINDRDFSYNDKMIFGYDNKLINKVDSRASELSSNASRRDKRKDTVTMKDSILEANGINILH